MKRTIRMLAIAFAFAIASGTAVPHAVASDSAQMTADERAQYEEQARENLDQMHTEPAGVSPEAPEYKDYRAALDDAETDWEAMKNASANEWQNFKQSFEESWAEVQRRYENMTE